MKFSIITPTYKRKAELERAIASLLQQTYKDWEMLIINDSPGDDSYRDFVVNDPRIRYYINDRNRGVNFSRNFGLEHLSAESKWVIFLDDDDYLAPDTLKNFMNLILLHGDQKWFMTNRALKNGQPLTQTPTSEKSYSYFWSYLFFKKIKGDATHCIQTKLLAENKIFFLKRVKQAEEWFFFFQVGIHTKLYYSDHNSTISDGYDHTNGLNFRRRTIDEKYKTLLSMWSEAITIGIAFRFEFLLYIFVRFLIASIR